MPFERSKLDVAKITPLLKHKWSEKLLNEGYVPFPKRLLRCAGKIFAGSSRLGELRVVLALADYARPDFKRSPTLAYLAYATGMTKKRVERCLASLRKRKLLKISELGSGTMEIDYLPLLKRAEALTEDD